MLKILFKTITLIGLCTSQIAAQTINDDSVFLAAAKENSIKLYNQQITHQSSLYNGARYVEPRTTNSEHPFFLTEEWQWGSVHYKNRLYTRVPLLYDLTSDKIVSESFNSTPIALVAEDVSAFAIGIVPFEFIETQNKGKGLPVSGFYEVLYGGRSKLVARHTKTLNEQIEDRSIQRYFKMKTRYYMLKDEIYLRVSGKGDILGIFADQKQAMKSWMKKNRVRFKKDKLVADLTAAASYYDALTPGTK
ncbi:MAG TPA: hypothetical protein VD884_18825 [Ohtaekwangia sp.]|nr:hypothetical protein [Ohtaekwangia sp.]